MSQLHHPYRITAKLACVLVILAGLQACDNSVEPFAEGNGHSFAVFGFLDTAADTQFVRVSHIGSVGTDPEEVDDPPVAISTHLGTGETVAWQDSVITLEDGSLGLVFFASFEVQPATTYRLDVANDGAAPTRAFTTLPGTNGISSSVPRRDRFNDLEQTLFWSNLARARDALVHYHVQALPSGADTTIAVTYIDSGEVTSNGWLIDVSLDRDYRIVRRLVETATGDTALVLLDLSMSIEALSEEWLVTGDATNIENGTGFFGSIARFRESWSLDSTIVQSIGYRTP